MKFIAMIACAISLTGCVHTADIVKALAQDTNSVNLNVNTIYGNLSFQRNMQPVILPLQVQTKTVQTP